MLAFLNYRLCETNIAALSYLFYRQWSENLGYFVTKMRNIKADSGCFYKVEVAKDLTAVSSVCATTCQLPLMSVGVIQRQDVECAYKCHGNTN